MCTWGAFAALVEANNGIFGGCWCMGFHAKAGDETATGASNCERKLELVGAGNAHAALVFDGDDCLGWAQLGTPDEPPRIKNRAAYEREHTILPDWRIACCYVDTGHRRNDSKLQVILFSLELQRRLTAAGSKVRSVLAHPGIATTALAAHSSSNAINRFSFFLNDPEHGALPTLFAATQNVSGNAYVGPGGRGSIKGNPKVRKPSREGLDAASAKKLWGVVSGLVGVSA